MKKEDTPKVMLIISCIMLPVFIILSATFLTQKDNQIASHEMGLCHISVPLDCNNNFNTYTSTLLINVTVNKCAPTMVVMNFNGICPQYKYSHPLTYKGRYYYPGTVYRCFLDTKNRCEWDEDSLLKEQIEPLTNLCVTFATLSSMLLVIVIPLCIYRIYEINKRDGRSYQLV